MGSRLDDRVCVVTGASSGIGRAIAHEFSRRGAHVVLAARREQALTDVLAECGGKGRAFVCDVGVREQVAALAASVASIEGRCDVLINNAGVGAGIPFAGDEQTLDRLDEVMRTNFFGAAWATAYLLPQLRSADVATIVNISSIAGLMPISSASMYCASKFALTGFSESLQMQLSGSNVRVVTVHPGPIPTPGFEHRRLIAVPVLRPMWTTTPALARHVARVCERRRPPATTVRPIIFRAPMLLRALAPAIYRLIARLISQGTNNVEIPTNADA